ncbi:response regulator transcription factor [uncultured Roseibium sp.]|uniref:response regulator transcription factor n=1 Tax=uncultured Roseibium sp. TaxID=1936171 RepID=UPI003217FC53
MRIAVVEDNAGLAKGIAYRFEDAGHAVDIIHDGADADDFLRNDGNDVIILDINLPGVDGLTLLKGLRARGDHRPVILLTARSDTNDRVLGLDAGADDYLVKPFAMEELEARLRALTRRGPQPIRNSIQFANMILDLDSRQVAVEGTMLDIPRRELTILEALMRAGGRIVTRQSLIEYIYGTGSDVEDTVIEVHISRLRKRLLAQSIKIQVHRGLGYALCETGP